MKQAWRDLLFLHWPLPPATLRPHLPTGLEVDTFDGEAWLGVVPFRMTGVRLDWLPPVPGLSAFCELNVRTYVTWRGEPGVWFFSLDAANAIAVAVARAWFHLPYFRARMSLQDDGSEIRYASVRTHRGARAGEFRGRYGPAGDVYRSRKGDLDHWLTERYCLYAADRRGRLYRGDVAHEPWPLQPAAASLETNTVSALALPDTEPLAHFARRVDVKVSPLRRLPPEA